MTLTKTYEELRQLSEEDVYTALFAKLNGPSSLFEKSFRELFAREHPTLQQAAVRHLLRPALEVLAAELPDARNRNSHEFAKLALEATASVHLPTI